MSNPFKYGPIALDESFTDRDAEVAELSADALNGQDVVIFAPRRYGKTSLVHRVAWLVCWIDDELTAASWLEFFKWSTAAYLLSRGIAKASRVLEQ